MSGKVDGLTYWKSKVEKVSPLAGGAVGAVVGALSANFTGRRTRRFAVLFGKRVNRETKIGFGALVGGVIGAGIGYTIRAMSER